MRRPRLGGSLAGGRPAQDHAVEGAAEALVEPEPARVHRAHGLHQNLRRHLFEHHAGHAEMERAGELVVVDRGGEHQHLGRELLVSHRGEHREPVGARHLEVEHQDVDRQLAQQAERFVAVAAAGDHLEVLFQPEQLGEAVEHDRVVVGERDPGRHRLSGLPDRKANVEPRALGARQKVEGAVQRGHPLAQGAGPQVLGCQLRPGKAPGEGKAAAVVGDGEAHRAPLARRD